MANGEAASAVKLQGAVSWLNAHPTVLGGHGLAVTLHLPLTRQGRPIQSTRDLRWLLQGSYRQVRADSAGRYRETPGLEEPLHHATTATGPADQRVQTAAGGRAKGQTQPQD